MKNEYKKRNAIGEKLPEQIGKGLNAEHWEKVKAAREVLETTAHRDKVYNIVYIRDFAKSIGIKPSDVWRRLSDNFVNNELDPSKLEIIVQEMVLKDEKIAELEYTLSQLRSQLLDTYDKDSVLIKIIDDKLN